MIKQPAYLKKGDKVAIVCPAKKLPGDINSAISILEDWGLEVVVGETVTASYHQFAGNDALRTSDLQRYLDNPEIKAVIAGRGGYGTIRIIDELDFSAFAENPKWIVGFSDITVLLSHIQAQYGIPGIHGPMPYTFADATPEALASLKTALFGGELIYESQNNLTVKNRSGEAEGELIGGNLTLLIMLQGSVSEMDYRNKILFIEDVGEHEYSVDRMMRMLKRNGKLSQLKGLIVGAFNEFEIESIPFGQTPEEVIWNLVKEYDYPVCFGFPVGHIDDNRAMVLGKQVKLVVAPTNTSISFNIL